MRVHQHHRRPLRFASLSSLLCLFLIVALNQDSGVLGFASNSPLSHNSTRSKLFRLEALSAEKTTSTSIVLNNAVGGLTFAGGLMGYVTKGSKASLIAGSTFGGLLLLSAYLVSSSKKAGSWLGSGVAGMLTYTMGKKFLKSWKFVPAGLIASLGALSFVFNLLGATMGTKDEPSGPETTESDDDTATERD
jgi:uncharacterized membrane protein (UPF0136 family)